MFNDDEADGKKIKALKYTTLITGGLALVFLLFKSSLFDFVGASDGFYRQNYGQAFIDAVKEDRKTFFAQDTLRSLVLVLLAAGTLWLLLMKKLSEKWVLAVFAVLILFDLVGVDRRYVNNENFVPANQVNKPYQPNAADIEIQKDTSHYRVLDVVSREPAKASYYHNSLTGYHAAKIGRYNELFDFHIVKNNINVLNMLNTKYIIAEDGKGNIFPYENTDANGNAWFVSEVKKLDNANAEIIALDSLNTKTKAVTTQSLQSKIYKADSTSTIIISNYKPNYLKYQSNNINDGFAVFSEIYYSHGWKAFIDGKEVPHYRVNYVLRGMEVPKGRHTIEFKFEPEVVEKGSGIALASTVVLVLLLLGGFIYKIRKPESEKTDQ